MGKNIFWEFIKKISSSGEKVVDKKAPYEKIYDEQVSDKKVLDERARETFEYLEFPTTKEESKQDKSNSIKSKEKSESFDIKELEKKLKDALSDKGFLTLEEVLFIESLGDSEKEIKKKLVRYKVKCNNSSDCGCESDSDSEDEFEEGLYEDPKGKSLDRRHIRVNSSMNLKLYDFSTTDSTSDILPKNKTVKYIVTDLTDNRVQYKKDESDLRENLYKKTLLRNKGRQEYLQSNFKTQIDYMDDEQRKKLIGLTWREVMEIKNNNKSRKISIY